MVSVPLLLLACLRPPPIDDTVAGSAPPEAPVADAIWYADVDGDGYGDPHASVSSVEPPAGCVASGTDCVDTNAEVFPGAPELCNHLDDDCDGDTDEEAIDELSFWPDADEDGFGDEHSDEVRACEAPSGWVASGSDCDDANAAAYPGAPEFCDMVQTDCADTFAEDAGLATFFSDDGAATDFSGVLAAGVEGAPAMVDMGGSGVLAICPGHYVVNVDSSAPDLTVVGLAGPLRTSLSGGGVGAVVRIEADNSVTTIQGLTLSRAGDFYGAVVTGTAVGDGGLQFALNPEVTLRDVVVTGNNNEGAAVTATRGSLLLESTEVSENDVYWGIYLVYSAGRCVGTDTSAAGVWGNAGFGVFLNGYSEGGLPANFQSEGCDFGQAASDNGLDFQLYDTHLINTTQSGIGDDAWFSCDMPDPGDCR